MTNDDARELLRHAMKHGIEIHITHDWPSVDVTHFGSSSRSYLPGLSEVRMDLRGTEPTMAKVMNVLLQILEEDEL